jgi:hypothetical protein
VKHGLGLLRWLGIVPIAAVLAPACSQGQGQGRVATPPGDALDIPDCWSGPFDLHPDFFAAVPSTGPDGVQTGSDALQIRVQNGGDLETFSDGLLIVIDDAGQVRGDPAADGTARPSLLGARLVVSEGPGVVPPGLPVVPVANPRIVHAALYLEHTCRTQNDALYALDAVTVNADGTCNRPDGGDPPLPCGAPALASDAVDGGPDATSTDAAAVSDAGAGTADAGPGATASNVRQSTIIFDSLFDNNPNEANAAARLTSTAQPVGFDLYLADPRERCPNGQGPPPRCRGHITGWFSFYFQRGRPAQPFP